MNSQPVQDVSFGFLRICGVLWYMAFLTVAFIVGIGMLTGTMEPTLKNALLLVWMPFVVAFIIFLVISPIILILTITGLLR
jgi:hypothetical protein